MIRLDALYVGDRAKCTIEAISGISGNFWRLLESSGSDDSETSPTW